MLHWAAVFLGIALIAAVFGFGGIASASAGIAQILAVVFLILSVLTLAARTVDRRAPRAQARRAGRQSVTRQAFR